MGFGFVPAPPFANLLTAGRIPWASTPDRLESGRLGWDEASGALRCNDGADVLKLEGPLNAESVRIGSASKYLRVTAFTPGADGGIRLGVHNLYNISLQANGGAAFGRNYSDPFYITPSDGILVEGVSLFGRTADNSSGRIQVGDHSNEQGGFGFRAGLSLFSLTSTLVRLTGNFSTSADMLADGLVRMRGGLWYEDGLGTTLQVVGNRRAGWGAAPGDGVRASLSSASSQADHNAALRALIHDLHGGAAGSHGLIGT